MIYIDQGKGLRGLVAQKGGFIEEVMQVMMQSTGYRTRNDLE